MDGLNGGLDGFRCARICGVEVPGISMFFFMECDGMCGFSMVKIGIDEL